MILKEDLMVCFFFPNNFDNNKSQLKIKNQEYSRADDKRRQSYEPFSPEYYYETQSDQRRYSEPKIEALSPDSIQNDMSFEQLSNDNDNQNNEFQMLEERFDGIFN